MELHNNDEQGFTLTETLVVIFLIAFGMVLLSSLFFAFNRTYNLEASRVDLYVETTIAMNRITEFIQTAKDVLPAQTVNGTAYSANNDEIVLALQSLTSTNAINTTSTDYVAFSLSGPELVEDVEANDAGRESHTRILTRFLTNLSFAYNTASAVDVTAVTVYMRAQRTIGEQPIEVNLQRTIRLRN